MSPVDKRAIGAWFTVDRMDNLTTASSATRNCPQRSTAGPGLVHILLSALQGLLEHVQRVIQLAVLAAIPADLADGV